MTTLRGNDVLDKWLDQLTALTITTRTDNVQPVVHVELHVHSSVSRPASLPDCLPAWRGNWVFFSLQQFHCRRNILTEMVNTEILRNTQCLLSIWWMGAAGKGIWKRNGANWPHVLSWRYTCRLFSLWYISASSTARSSSFFFSSKGCPLPPITTIGWVRYGWIFSTLSTWKITRSTSLGSLWLQRSDRKSGISFLLPLHGKKAGINLCVSGFWAIFPRTKFNWHLICKAMNIKATNYRGLNCGYRLHLVSHSFLQWLG